MSHNKKKVRKIAVFLILLSIFLVSVNAAKSDWVQYINGNSPCIDCYSEYRICKYADLSTIGEKFDIGWQDVKGLIQDYTQRVKNFKLEVRQTRSEEVPVYGYANLSYTCPTEYFNYSIQTKEAWCWQYHPGNDSYSLLKYVQFTSGNLPTKTVYYNNYQQIGTTYEDYYVWNTYSKDTIKQAIINADIGTCWNVRVSGVINWGDSIDHFLQLGSYNYTEYDWWNATFNYRYEITVSGNTSFGDVREINLTSANISYDHCDAGDLAFTYENSSTLIEEKTNHYVWDWDESGDSFVFLKLRHTETANGIATYYLYCNATSGGTNIGTTSIFVDITNFTDASDCTWGYWSVCGSAAGTPSQSDLDCYSVSSDPTERCLHKSLGSSSAINHSFGADYPNHLVRTMARYSTDYFDFRTSSSKVCYTDQSYYVYAAANSYVRIYPKTAEENSNVERGAAGTWHLLEIISKNGDDRYFIVDRKPQVPVADFSATDGSINSVNLYTDVYTSIIDEMMLYQSSYPLQGISMGAEEAPAGGASNLTIEFNHSTLNTTIQYSLVNITLSSSINQTQCFVTFDGIQYQMNNYTPKYYYYEFNDTIDYNHTYFANCTNGSLVLNSTAGFTKVDTPLNLTWDWDDLNTTITLSSSSAIYVNTTNADVCIINFNHTNYTMTDLGDRWRYNTGALANGNYSVIYVVCNDSLNNTNTTTLGWLNVSYNSPSNTTLTHMQCPIYLDLGQIFEFWVNYSTTDGAEISDGNVTITVNNDTYNLSYNGAEKLYKGNFTFTALGTYLMEINATAASRGSQNDTCIIYVIDSFNITVKIWEQVEREVMARTNYTIITVKNYDVEFIDPYINEFGYIFMINLDVNNSELYTDCNLPFASGEQLMDLLNWGNFWGDAATSTFKDLYGSLAQCDKYWFRGEYRHGEANITVYWPGNYTIFFISGTLMFENDFSPPRITHGGLSIPFGLLNFNDSSSNYEIELYVPHSELDFWGSLSDGFFIFFVIIFPLMLFITLMFLGVGIKSAVGVALLFPTLITLIKMIGLI